jgi:hypothetical protein
MSEFCAKVGEDRFLARHFPFVHGSPQKWALRNLVN